MMRRTGRCCKSSWSAATALRPDQRRRQGREDQQTGWTQVEVPLVTLASDDKLVDGLWVQNASGTDLPKFCVTEIRLQ
jgi:hypothetical protein